MIVSTAPNGNPGPIGPWLGGSPIPQPIPDPDAEDKLWDWWIQDIEGVEADEQDA